MDRLLKDNLQFITMLDSRIESCKLACDEFIKEFAENPSYALSWSQVTFERSAELNVLTYVRGSDKATFTSLQAHAKRETMNKAMHPSYSTSQVSNLMSQYTLAAWARMLEYSEEYGKIY